MARAMKVFSGTVYKYDGCLNCILATTTKKQACEILDISMGDLNNYWYCWEIDGCGQPHIKEQALAQPNIPLFCDDRDQYKKDIVYKTLEEFKESGE